MEWTTDSPGLCLVALTVLKRAGSLDLQKPSYEKREEVWPAGRLGMTPSRSLLSPPLPSILLGRSFHSSLGLLTCFALVRPSHLYLGVVRQKRDARFDFGLDRSGRSSFVKSEGSPLENFERRRERERERETRKRPNANARNERQLHLGLKEKGFILFTAQDTYLTPFKFHFFLLATQLPFHLCPEVEPKRCCFIHTPS